MANIHEFQLVAEVSAAFLRAFLRGAWKSGGKKLGEPLDPGTIPESLDIVPGTAFGSFVLQDGQIQISKDELDVALVAGVGVDIKVGLRGQAHLLNAQNPVVPSLSLRDITAEVHVVAPIGELTGPGHVPHEVGVQLKAAPKPTVKLTGPDPAARLSALIEEQVRSLAASAPTLPTEPMVPFAYKGVDAYTASERLELLSDASHQVAVTDLPGMPPRLRVSIPVKFSLFSVVPAATDPPPPLLEGFLVEATVVATAVLSDDPGSPGGHIVQLGAPTTVITVDDVKPGGAVAHYTANQMRLGAGFDSTVVEHIRRQGRNFLAQLGDLKVSIPTVASIEDALATLLQAEMATLDFITIWPPKDAAQLPLPINDVKVRVLADALVLAINPETGADANGLTNFLPAGRDLVVAISAHGVQNIFDTQKQLHDPFHRYHGDDYDVDLKTLTFGLKSGAIHFDGEMTVIDVAGCIDVDASFGVDVHLKWAANHSMQVTPDTPDVDTRLSILAWVISLILGFITAGGLGLVIAALIDKVAEMIAANFGAGIVDDPGFTAVAAWPADLPKIGNVTANFDNPIEISPDGLLFSAAVAP